MSIEKTEKTLLEYPNWQTPEVFKQFATEVHPATVVEGLQDLDPIEIVKLIQILNPELRGEIFGNFNREMQIKLAPHFRMSELANLLENMNSDERIDFFQALDEDIQERVLPLIARAEREDIRKLGAYEEGTAGAIMTSDYATLAPELTAAEAIDALRKQATDRETIYYSYIIDSNRHILGVIGLRELILAPPYRLVKDIMNEDVISAKTTDNIEDVTRLFDKYDFIALPVVNEDVALVGLITVDDVLDQQKKKAANTLTRFGGTLAIDDSDIDLMNSPLKDIFKMRFFWLVVLTFFGVFTSTYIAKQTDMLEKLVILSAFIAPIVDMGGNAGSQSASLVLRALSLGQLKVRWKDITLVLLRELPVALALGLVIGILEVILARFSKGLDYNVLLVVGLSMTACTVAGGVIGVLLPFAAKKIGTDPATLSSPMITSIMDLAGVMIYFSLAYWLLL